MECFAGYLSHADAQIGRVFEFLRAIGEWENTLVLVVSDNGASAEGGPTGSINEVRLFNVVPAGADELRARIGELGSPTTHNNYPWGWSMAGNTPFRRWKREVHEGGVADPCLLSWPARIPGGGPPRRQFAHAIDMVPTILDLIGMAAPAEIAGVAQAPIEGTSLAPVLLDATAPETHTVQYFEMFGSRAIHAEGWKAVTFKPSMDSYQEGRDPDLSFEDDVWELYHVIEDPSETRDLARSERERLARMVELWWTEAQKYRVLPLDNRIIESTLNHRRPPVEASVQVVWPFGAPLPENRVLNLRHRDHSLEVSVVIPPGGAEGVLLAMGTVLGGWSLHLLGGRLRYVHNFVGAQRDEITAPQRVAPGRRLLGFEFVTSNGGGTGRLRVDGHPVGEGEIPRVPIARYNLTGGGLTCGWEQGPAVGPGYQAPFWFTGQLYHAVIRVGREPAHDLRAGLDPVMAKQ
jgi:arylsulfatase